MKRTLAAALILVFILSLLPFSAGAVQNHETWDYNSDTHVIPFSTGTQFYYNHQPTVNETIAFEGPYGQMNMTLTAWSESLQTYFRPPLMRVLKNDKVIFVVDFQVGLTYTLGFDNFQSNPSDVTVKTYDWVDDMYPTVKPGETKTVTITPGRSASYIASVPTSGLYTLSLGHADFHGNITSYPDMNLSTHTFPVHLGYWQENGCYRYCYYMEAGVEYDLEIFCEGSSDVTGTFSLKAGSTNDDYGVWKDGESKTLTIEPHDNEDMKFKTFVFSPKQDGKYCIFSDKFYASVRSEDGGQLMGEVYQDAMLNQGTVCNLEKGKFYTISVHNYGDETYTDEITLKHYTSYSSAQLKILRYSESEIVVGLFSEPNCSIYDGVSWNVKDSSVLSMTPEELIPRVTLNVLKQGRTEVSATVNGATAKLTVSTQPNAQTLSQGVLANLYIPENYSHAGSFTPAASGTYRLSLTPYTSTGTSVELKTSSGQAVYSNNNLTEPITADVTLLEGTEYQLFLRYDPVDVKIDLISVSNPSGSTNPTVTPTQPTPSGSTNPAVTPTQPTPTTPAENQPTTPATQPQSPTVNPDSSTDETTSPTHPTQGATESGGEVGNPTGPVESTSPSAETRPVTDAVTEEDVKDAIDEALKTDQTVHFTVVGVDNRTLELTNEALQAAVDNGLSISTEFICGTTVSLSQDVLSGLGNAGEDTVKLSVTPQHFGVLNEDQAKAIDGLVHGKLLDISLSVAEQNIHQLGGKAKITLANPNPGQVWMVLYLSEDGTAEQMETDIDDHSITFYTDHFSYFVLAHDQTAHAVDSDNGSANWIWIVLVLILVAGGAAAVIILKKKGRLAFHK